MRRRHPLEWLIPTRVKKRSEILPGVGLKETMAIAGFTILGFIIGSIAKNFVSGTLLSSLVGLVFPAALGFGSYYVVAPNMAWDENILTIMRRNKAFKKSTKVYYYQKRR